MDSLRFSRGNFVERKFEETSTQSCMSIVLSAIDELLFQVAQSKPLDHLSILYSTLASEFDSSFHFLTMMLPNILLFRSPSQVTQQLCPQSDNNVNFMSLCFTLQRFMSIISAATGHPFMLFLDGKSLIDGLYDKSSLSYPSYHVQAESEGFEAPSEEAIQARKLYYKGTVPFERAISLTL